MKAYQAGSRVVSSRETWKSQKTHRRANRGAEAQAHTFNGLDAAETGVTTNLEGSGLAHIKSLTGGFPRRARSSQPAGG